jgi:hypothetical protein
MIDEVRGMTYLAVCMFMRPRSSLDFFATDHSDGRRKPTRGSTDLRSTRYCHGVEPSDR